MATNGPKGGGRRGAVAKRDQVYNPRNRRWTKRGSDKKFMDQMSEKHRTFRGVRKK
ncbi:hypothetical protein COU20_01835 [Candidatus Kaiserbacteria bacterium CG10_big_fil_rev_8_21_14_0_10_59_10]|uniref:Uncharacterized protein n=1 Tax=Candidatus Kaiserbacteria bacterium CG10_big_fil_rev_8_21_14_0_10_59_10 TaxID=1974612 RepID=A0A2H0U7X3_9BACT|nr:MAG: hypothetical protein COU20_01835 [Candidatus Kaiserbacteria bacterium CG10_big_fil_rev_8_21_14_0_10_59_10]